MYVKFADTNGEVFELSDDDNVFEHYLNPDLLKLGAVFTYTDGIVIVDRKPNHATSQLNVDDIIELLRQLLIQMFLGQINNINIYLPRMYSSMIKEAESQEKFQNMFVSTSIVPDSVTAAANNATAIASTTTTTTTAAALSTKFADKINDNANLATYVCNMSRRLLDTIPIVNIQLNHV